MENNNTNHDNKVIVKACIFFGVLTLLAFLLAVFAPFLLEGKKKNGETTTKAPDTSKAIEYDVVKVSTPIEDSYYAEKFILLDNKLYALPTKDWKDATTDFDYEGKKYVTVATNVEKVYMVTPGQAGLVSIYYTDKDLNAYYLNNIMDIDKTPGTTKKVDGAVNIVDIYTLSGADAMEFVMINKDNQIVPTMKDYIFYDKKNNIGKTLLSDGTIVELSDPVVSKIDENKSNLSMKMVVNGTEATKRVDYEMLDDMASYEDIDLFVFKLCKDKKGKYQAGESCL